MSRRPVPIDLDELEKLAAMHCTQDELAAWFGISQPAICKKLQQEPFKSRWERGWSKGNVSLRRAQFQQAEAGNGTMLVWLGKQWLGQRDVQRLEHSGPDGKPIEVADARQRLEDEIAAVIAEAERATEG